MGQWEAGGGQAVTEVTLIRHYQYANVAYFGGCIFCFLVVSYIPRLLSAFHIIHNSPDIFPKTPAPQLTCLSPGLLLRATSKVLAAERLIGWR